jgi:hypothetical protein
VDVAELAQRNESTLDELHSRLDNAFFLWIVWWTRSNDKAIALRIIHIGPLRQGIINATKLTESVRILLKVSAWVGKLLYSLTPSGIIAPKQMIPKRNIPTGKVFGIATDKKMEVARHMKRQFIAIGIIFTGFSACKPASFKNIDAIEATEVGAIESVSSSEDAVGISSGEVLDEANEAEETGSVVPPKTNGDELKLACADSVKKGSIKSKVIPLMFPAKTKKCDFEKYGNLNRKDGVIRARRGEFVELPLQGMTRLCSMKFTAEKQLMKFDDEILITLNRKVVVSSQDFSVNSKDQAGDQVYPTGLSVDADGVVSYKWLSPNGLQNQEYHGNKLTRYCLGLDPNSPTFDQTCQIPKTDTNGTMSLSLPQDAFLKLAIKAGLVFDKQLQQLPKATLGFITTGDNDDSDCQHLDFEMLVTVEYIP